MLFELEFIFKIQLQQSSLIVPYSNEPLTSSGDEFDERATDDEDDISSETLGKRFDMVSHAIIYFNYISNFH